MSLTYLHCIVLFEFIYSVALRSGQMNLIMQPDLFQSFFGPSMHPD